MAKIGEYGVKALRKIQLGKEAVATPGTAVLPSTIWRGTGTMKDMRPVTHPDENIGYLANPTRAYIPFTGSELTLSSTPATFEQFQTLLESGIATATPAHDGSGGYISAYTFPTTTGNAIQTRTAETGDNQETDSSAFMFTREFGLTGAEKTAVMMDAVMEGRSPEPVVYSATLVFVASGKHITDAANGLAVFTAGMTIRVSGTTKNDGVFTVATPGAGDCVVSETVTGESAVACTIEQIFTAAATLPDVEEILFGKGKLFIGDIGTAFSALAQVTKTWLGFTYKVTTGKQSIFTGDGDLFFSGVKTIKPMVTVQLVMEWNGSASAERRKAKLVTPRKVRMLFEGSAFAVAGTTYAKKTLILDGAGVWDTFQTIDEQNGDDIVKANFVYGYNAADNVFHAVTLVNNLATVL